MAQNPALPTRSPGRKSQHKLAVLVPALACIGAVSLGGCTSSNRDRAAIYRQQLAPAPSASPSGTAPVQLSITRVDTVASGSNSGPQSSGLNFEVRLNVANVNGNLGALCPSSSTGANSQIGCSCLVKWTEENTTQAATVPINRQVLIRATDVKISSVICPIPAFFNFEVPNGTQLRLSLVPDASNAIQFTSSVQAFTKGVLAQEGDFKDSEGRKFQDILEYSCFDLSKIGAGVASKLETATFSLPSAQVTKDVTLVLASQFCKSRGRDGSGFGSDDCKANGMQQFEKPTLSSAQAYYYNLYTLKLSPGRSEGNNAFICPQVDEKIKSFSDSFFPNSSTFALALQPYSGFNVGVEARTRVPSTDAGSVPSGCTILGPSPAPSSVSGSSGVSSPALVVQCLGYAARPRADGTCPVLVNEDGSIRPMYRLRRYTALYPLQWDVTGAPLNEGVRTDVVYVLDRPVDRVGGDPNVTYTMRGPLPCPFAYFDHRNLTGATNTAARYVSTNDSGWNGVNPDGFEFPNTDLFRANGPSSCSAAIPLLSDDLRVMTYATVNPTNPVLSQLFIRPGRAWSPQYQEDTDFLACAPRPKEAIDPPLHFTRNNTTGVVSWCAERYPNMNVKMQVAQGTLPGHTGAVQRSATNRFADEDRFPLLATASGIETALLSTPAYRCLVTYDEGNGKSDRQSPQGGCCLNTVNSGSAGASSAHLEPFQSSDPATLSPCRAPTY
jgi:hypothetical protein